MATLLLDLDGDTLGSVGTAVTAWTDSVGSRAFTQATTALQPAVVAGPNSHKAAKFDGDVLSSLVSATAQSAITMSMVFRLDAVPTAARSGIISGTATASDNDYAAPNWGFTNPFSATETAFDSIVLTGAGTGGNDQRMKTVSNPLGTFVVLLATIGTDGVGPRLYTNGTADTVSTGGADVADMPLARLNLGARYYGSNADFGKFTLAKLRIHSGYMSAAERTAEHTLLSNRYAITVSDYASSDATAPTVPSAVTATANSATQVTVSWTASTDAVGVQSYRVRRGGSDLSGATAVTGTSFVDTTATAGTAYSYTVSAVDAAGNRSAESSPASVTTPSPDVTAPTVPSNVTATSNSTGTTVALAWTASTDTGGVQSYRIRRNGADLSGATAVTGTSYTDSSVTTGTAYSYTVSARDATGNRSAESTAAAVTPLVASAEKFRVDGAWLSLIDRHRLGGSWLTQVSKVIGAVTTPVTPPEPAPGFPAALGSLTTRPSWTNATVAAGPLDQPAVSTRTRTLQLPNLPASGSDLSAAWMAYFGNQVGSNGTWAAGDRVTIPAGEWVHSGNLDIPPAVNDVEVVFGSSSAACTLTATDATSGNNTPPAIGLRVLSANNIRLRAASSSYPTVLRSRGMAGRGDKNQQGHALLEVEYCTGFRAQDLILQDSKAAGVFMYRASNYWFNRVRVERSKADAWHAANGCSYGIYSDCSSDGAGDDMMAFVHYDGRDAPVAVSHHMEVYRYIGRRNGHGRGFAVIATHDIYADQVIIEGSAAASVIVDREAASGATQAEQSISNVLLQRFLITGPNWSEQDHGAVFVGNGNTNGTVTGVQMESFTIRDGRYYAVVRGVGSGLMTAVFKDFTQTGLLPSLANNNRTKVGGNWADNGASTMTQTNWIVDTANQVDTTAPTVVINSPGHLATVLGTLTGSSGGSTHLMTNAQAIQYYVGDNGGGDGSSGLATVSITVDGSTGNGLGTPTSRDAAGRGSVTWNTTAVANGQHTVTVTATDKGGNTTVRNITVTVAN